ncbi:hypothetical protein [Malikia sp.]|uniref:tetratricopeptide repeat protein n=1 Tax=Malikia sp. TaxID=2070706 RepID=UPI002625B68C|nr:hypothetical protein [Malikia sp.]MDD2730205.1 hypothetical protein [Malikia sp.]
MTMPTWLIQFAAAMALLVALATAWLGWAASATPATSAPAGDSDLPARRWVWALVLLVPLLVVLVYARLGHPVAANPAHHLHQQSPLTMVDKLAQRLRENPDQPEGWLMLGRSYQVLSRYADAAMAYEQAEPLALQDVDTLTDWIESRMQAAQGHFDARSLELLRKAQALETDHPAVLLLGGLAALDRGDQPAATRLLKRLQALTPDGTPDRASLDRALEELAQGRDPRLKPSVP